MQGEIEENQGEEHRAAVEGKKEQLVTKYNIVALVCSYFNSVIQLTRVVKKRKK